MKKIYTISSCNFENKKFYFFENRKDWEKKISSMSYQEDGRGGGITVAIYEVPNNAYIYIENNRGWTGKEYHGRRIYADNPTLMMTTGEMDEDGDEIAEEVGSPIDQETVDYWCVRKIEDAEDDSHGKYIATDWDDIYDTEEEALTNNDPVQYLTI